MPTIGNQNIEIDRINENRTRQINQLNLVKSKENRKSIIEIVKNKQTCGRNQSEQQVNKPKSNQRGNLMRNQNKKKRL